MQPVAYQKTFEYEKDYWWFVGRRDIVSDMMQCHGIEGNVLADVGSGTGYTLHCIDRFKFKIGIEKSVEAFRFFRGEGTALQVCGDGICLPLADSSVDCALLLDVLEHLDDEAASLSEIYRVCKANGAVIITVPAFQFLWSGEDFVSQHKRRYRCRELREIVQAAGFRKIEKISYFNFFLLPLVLTVIFIKHFLGKKIAEQTNLFPIPKILNRLFLGTLTLENFFLRYLSFPAGSSLICVARK